MTTDEAIKYLKCEVEEADDEGANKPAEAIRLGIEALKAVKECRASHMFCPGLVMPGETTEPVGDPRD